MTKDQALAIGPPPDFKDTAAAEIFYWQLTGMEWDGSRSAYHSHATKKWRRLTESSRQLHPLVKPTPRSMPTRATHRRWRKRSTTTSVFAS